MCEAHAYLLAGGASDQPPERVMENVVRVSFDGDIVVLQDLFGDEVRLDATVKEIALIEHRIFLEPRHA
ncbi:MAG: CooT family nickel-binding protein [Actinobacteria bacterium]|nr:CooT family nickel-binding protein [Actinomycetota bacterium]